MALTLLSLSFVAFLLLGVPVAFAIGLSCLATFAFEGLPFETAIQMMVSEKTGADSKCLLSSYDG